MTAPNAAERSRPSPPRLTIVSGIIRPGVKAPRLSGAGSMGRRWQYADDRHHAVVLMAENMAVVNKVADIHAPEIHADLDARIRSRPAPLGDVDHVQILPRIRRHRHTVLLHQQKMDLVHVEFVVLGAP